MALGGAETGIEWNLSRALFFFFVMSYGGPGPGIRLDGGFRGSILSDRPAPCAAVVVSRSEPRWYFILLVRPPT